MKYVSTSPILCDNINGYLCLCNPGWMGNSCEIRKYLTYSLCDFKLAMTTSVQSHIFRLNVRNTFFLCVCLGVHDVGLALHLAFTQLSSKVCVNIMAKLR